MNLIPVIWSAAAASCVTLALVRLLLCYWIRKSKASVCGHDDVRCNIGMH